MSARMGMFRGAVGIVSLSLLASCASPRQASPVQIEVFPLLEPSTLRSEFSVQQILRASFDKQSLTATSALDIHGDTLTAVALTPTGQRLFSVGLKGSELTFETQTAVPGPTPRQLLADIQLSMWPLDALQKVSAGTAWKVSEVARHTRRLHRDGRLVAEVHYADPTVPPWRSRLWLVNFQFGYSLSVEPVPPS